MTVQTIPPQALTSNARWDARAAYRAGTQTVLAQRRGRGYSLQLCDVPASRLHYLLEGGWQVVENDQESRR